MTSSKSRGVVRLKALGITIRVHPKMRQLMKIVEELFEAMSPTERTRRYNKRHPDKVRSHLKKTQEDRVERNRARREAVKKHGKTKMRNHDVHHVDNVKNSKRTRLAPRDHGPDKKK